MKTKIPRGESERTELNLDERELELELNLLSAHKADITVSCHATIDHEIHLNTFRFLLKIF